MALSSESGDGFILAHLEENGVAVKYRDGAPREPARNTGAFLDHMDKFAVEVVLSYLE